jgi:hypothetical protein
MHSIITHSECTQGRARAQPAWHPRQHYHVWTVSSASRDPLPITDQHRSPPTSFTARAARVTCDPDQETRGKSTLQPSVRAPSNSSRLVLTFPPSTAIHVGMIAARLSATSYTATSLCVSEEAVVLGGLGEDIELEPEFDRLKVLRAVGHGQRHARRARVAENVCDSSIIDIVVLKHQTDRSMHTR